MKSRLIPWLAIVAVTCTLLGLVAAATLSAILLVGCSAKQDRTYYPKKDGYIVNWLVLGPVPLEDFEKGNTALDSPKADWAAKIQPKAGQKITIGNQALEWRVENLLSQIKDSPRRKQSRPPQPTVHLGGQGSGSAPSDKTMDKKAPDQQHLEDRAAYAVCYVNSEHRMEDVEVRFESDSGEKLFINGIQIIRCGKPKVRPDGSLPANFDKKRSGTVTLRKGTSTVSCFVVNPQGNFQGRVRFIGANDKPLTNLKILLSPNNVANLAKGGKPASLSSEKPVFVASTATFPAVYSTDQQNQLILKRGRELRDQGMSLEAEQMLKRVPSAESAQEINRALEDLTDISKLEKMAKEGGPMAHLAEISMVNLLSRGAAWSSQPAYQKTRIAQSLKHVLERTDINPEFIEKTIAVCSRCETTRPELAEAARPESATPARRGGADLRSATTDLRSASADLRLDEGGYDPAQYYHWLAQSIRSFPLELRLANARCMVDVVSEMSRLERLYPEARSALGTSSENLLPSLARTPQYSDLAHQLSLWQMARQLATASKLESRKTSARLSTVAHSILSQEDLGGNDHLRILELLYREAEPRPPVQTAGGGKGEQGAAEQFLEALKEAIGSEKVSVDAKELDKMAWKSFYLYQYRMAAVYWDIAAEITDKRDPQAAHYRFLQGEMLHFQGRSREAIAIWERIGKEGYAETPEISSLRKSWLTVGYTAIGQGQKAQELRYIEELHHEFDPNK